MVKDGGREREGEKEGEREGTPLFSYYEYFSEKEIISALTNKWFHIYTSIEFIE